MSEPKFTPDTGVLSKTLIFIETKDERLIAIAPQLLKAVETLVHEQCQITCKDWEKPCALTCWVLEYKKLIAEAKGEE